MCEALAVFFTVVTSHCVDDMMVTGPTPVVRSGWDYCLCLGRTCGWEISDAKYPPPSAKFMVIGVTLDMTETPDGPAKLVISRNRVRALQLVLWRTIDSGILRPGEASSLAGKLGFALTAVFGRIGRADMRPISRDATVGTADLTSALSCARVYSGGRSSSWSTRLDRYRQL